MTNPNTNQKQSNRFKVTDKLKTKALKLFYPTIKNALNNMMRLVNFKQFTQANFFVSFNFIEKLTALITKTGRKLFSGSYNRAKHWVQRQRIKCDRNDKRIKNIVSLKNFLMTIIFTTRI
jgi:hypothetical protein